MRLRRGKVGNIFSFSIAYFLRMLLATFGHSHFALFDHWSPLVVSTVCLPQSSSCAQLSGIEFFPPFLRKERNVCCNVWLFKRGHQSKPWRRFTIPKSTCNEFSRQLFLELRHIGILLLRVCTFHVYFPYELFLKIIMILFHHYIATYLNFLLDLVLMASLLH